MPTLKGVALSDKHCGHFTGLTPPAWQGMVKSEKIQEMQEMLWGFFSTEIRSLGKLDFLLDVGDGMDGLGKRSGGTEIFTQDMDEQSEMDADCNKFVHAEYNIKVDGTPYHESDSDGMDWGRTAANKIGADVYGGHEWVDINGVMFDLKHKVGGSQIPHGRFTALAKEHLWNQLWFLEQNANPLADVIIRAHVHYHGFCGGPDWLGMTLPALQGPGSKYGVRQCSGTVHFGFVSFEIKENGEYTWKPHVLKLEEIAKPFVIR